MTHSPQLNQFLPDSHSNTNFSNYLKDVVVNQKDQNPKKLSLNYKREQLYNNTLKVQNSLKVDIVQRKSLYKILDFYNNETFSHSEYNNEKFLEFVKNTVSLSEVPQVVFVFVVESQEVKDQFCQDIRRMNMLNNKEGLIWNLQEDDGREELPVYFSVITQSYFNEVIETLPEQYGEEFIEKFTNWSEESLKTNFIQEYDIIYLDKYQQFTKNIVKIVEKHVKNSENLMGSDKTMAELLGSMEYTQFKEFWFSFQENLFMSQMLYSQLQYQSAKNLLNKCQLIFYDKLVPILSTNRAGTSDKEYWVFLDFLKQYTFTLITFMSFCVYVAYFVKKAPEISYYSKKVI